jgi:aryl-alcohol dehydrogenase-like predicted oxidoreductase
MMTYGSPEWRPWVLGEAAAAPIVRAAVEAGITFFDTADVYSDGASEIVTGRVLKPLLSRDELVIATKLFSPMTPGPNGRGLSRKHVLSAIDASLQRLGLDYVDLYQVHWRDGDVPLEETWGAMAELVEQGLARHIGVSNFDLDAVERCLAIHHVASVQNELSLLNRDDLALPAQLAERGVGYLAYSPLAKGLLTGAVTRETTFAQDDWRSGGGRFFDDLYGNSLEQNIDRVDRVRPIAERLGMPLSVVAVRWLLEQPGVTAAITGSRSADHQRENAAAGEVSLERSVVDELTRFAA